MSNLQHKKIAVIGGGPGGLTLARLLQMQGIQVTVYERDVHKDARPKGATLDLHEASGLAALRAADLMEAFRNNYRPDADKLRILDQNATIFFDDHQRNDDKQAVRPEIDRGPLQTLLLDALKPDTVRWNSRFAGLSRKNNQVRIEFENGTIDYADLVVGADGARSRVRPFITPIQPFYSGITVVEGAVRDAAKNVPYIHNILRGGKIFALGNSQSLIVSAKGDGSLVFYTGCKTNENWAQSSGIDFADKASVMSWFKETFRGWNDSWLDLFANADLPFIPRPQYCMPLDQHWESLPDSTMLGDAAHLMPPYAGEGVNMAMQDALELSQCLTLDEHADLQTAIAAYEKQMLKRASETAAMTIAATEALHAPEALAFMMGIVQPENE